jgi:hypothetical protein
LGKLEQDGRRTVVSNTEEKAHRWKRSERREESLGSSKSRGSDASTPDPISPISQS